MRGRISSPAATVKVPTSNSLTSPRRSGGASQIRYAQRSASTDVFPEPAAADTSTLRPTVSIARFCCGVHFVDDLALEVPVEASGIARLLYGALDDFIARVARQRPIAIHDRIEAAHRAIRTVRARRVQAHPIRLRLNLPIDDLIRELTDATTHQVQ